MIAIYMRLSKEDKSQNGDSNSIENQRELIYNFIKESFIDTDSIKEYSDDGYSGMNFNRPNIKKLLNDIKKGEITCIIVKDFSRFSRDYLEMGGYLNQIFPFMGIRFISINDNYDNIEKMGIPVEVDDMFKTLLNYYYSIDISLKVKSTIKNKCENGEYIFGLTPFGYEKSKVVKNEIIINWEEATIVQYIFKLAYKGLTAGEIAQRLSKENVKTCQQIRKKNSELLENNLDWSSTSVIHILKNPFYIGDFIYNKTRKESVGSKKKIKNETSQYKIIHKHHEAIVSKQVFDEVNKNRQNGNSKKRTSIKHPLTGHIYCGNCGRLVCLKRETIKRAYACFECRSKKELLNCCRYFRVDKLEHIIVIMFYRELLLLTDTSWLKNIVENIFEVRSIKIQKMEKKNNLKLARINRKKQKLYEEFAENRLDVIEYKKREREFECLYTNIEEENNLLKEKQEMDDRWKWKINDNIRTLFQYLKLTELSQEMMDLFIDKIKIYKNKRVEIIWNFKMSIV